MIVLVRIARNEIANLALHFRIQISLASLGKYSKFRKEPQATSKFSKTVPYEA